MLSPSLQAVAQIYQDSVVPVALADGELSVLWSNQAAQTLHPSLTMPDGLRVMMISQSPQEVLGRLSRKNSVTILLDTLLGAASQVSFTKIGAKDQPQEILVHFFLDRNSGESPLNPLGAEQVLSSFSNQFRAPLSIIFSALSSVSRQLERSPHSKNEAIQDSIRRINQNCYKMLKNCGNITLMGRYLNSITGLSAKRINFSAHLEELCRAMRIITESAGIPLQVSVPAGVILICDVEKLDLVFLNLIANACKFSRQGNAISITVTPNSNRLMITVADFGWGMSPQVVERAFDPYYSCNPQTNGPAGAGLGLTLVKRIINEHAGTVAIDSREGQGTRILLSLPLTDDPSLPLTLCDNATAYLSDKFSPVFVQLCEISNMPLP